WMATLLLQSGAAATLFPLFGLLRRNLSRRASWLASAFWPSVPALAVFIPKSDCLYPFLALGILWLWFAGLERRSRILCTLAGLCFWTGMLLSLAFLPVAVIALVMTVHQIAFPSTHPMRDGSWPLTTPDRNGGWLRGLKTWAGLAALAAAGFAV